MGMKAVGGGMGAGCAGFSLVGILVSITIVGYLATRTTDSVSKAPKSVTTLPTIPGGAELTPDGIADLTIPGATTAGAAVRVEPATDLTDQKVVKVIGTGFAPGPVEVTTCLTHDFRSSDGTAGCGENTTGTTTADATGAFTMDYPVGRVIAVLGTEYDCAALAGGCSLVAHPPGAFDDGPSAPVTFAAGLPPSSGQPPPDR